MTSHLSAAIEQVKREAQHDPVTRPIHYCEGAIECIDAIEAAINQLDGVEAYLTGQCIKYIWRWKSKGGHEDLRKCRWYLNRLIGLTETTEQAIERLDAVPCGLPRKHGGEQ